MNIIIILDEKTLTDGQNRHIWILRDGIDYVHVDDKRMIHTEQNVFLILNVLNLFQSDDVGDSQDFQRPVFPRALFTTQHHSSECSSS